MKKLFSIVILAILVVGLFSFNGCIDPDEALPHYEQVEPK